jgi:hypothetical protein
MPTRRLVERAVSVCPPTERSCASFLTCRTALPPHPVRQGWVEKYPNEPTFVVPECLKAKVAAGKLGRKTGEGFYHWDGDKPLGPVE